LGLRARVGLLMLLWLVRLRMRVPRLFGRPRLRLLRRDVIAMLRRRGVLIRGHAANPARRICVSAVLWVSVS